MVRIGKSRLEGPRLVLTSYQLNGDAILQSVSSWSQLTSSVALPFYRAGVPEQAVGGIPLGFGIVVQDKPTEFPCTS